MGFGSRRREVTRVALSEEGYWADVRPMTLGESEAWAQRLVRQRLAKRTESGGIAGDNMTSLLLVETIKAWNVDGDDGAVLPITRETVGLLFPEDVKAITEIVSPAPRSDEEQVDFSPASPHGPADEAPPSPGSAASAPTASSGASLA